MDTSDSLRVREIKWSDPVRTARAITDMGGLEFLRAVQNGELSPPPIASVFGFTILEVEVGRTVFDCVPEESSYNFVGTVHGGLVSTLADTVAGCAVHTTLEVGATYTSIDLCMNFLRPVTTDCGRLVATGKVIKPGRRVACASAEIRDSSNKLVATATSNCLIIQE